MSYRYSFNIIVRWSILDNDHHSLGSPDINIVTEGNSDSQTYYYFASPHLDTLNDPKTVWARALYLKSLYVGAYNLIYNSDHGGYKWVGSGALSGLHETIDGQPRRIHIDNVAAIKPSDPFDESVLNQPLTHWDLVDSNVITTLIYLTRTRKDIRHLLLQLGNELDWKNLYSILDTLEHYTIFGEKKSKDKSKYKQMLKTALVSSDDIDAFTGTANNYGLLGVEARHGEKGWTAPKKRITLPEAKRLMIGLGKSYLLNEYNIDTGPMAINNFCSADDLF